MSEKMPSLNNIPDSSSGSSQPSIQQVPSIQQPAPSGGKSAARGDSRSAPVLFVETLSLENLLERAELDLEAEFWSSAVLYADRALALDPDCARAYLYKLQADLKVPSPGRLKEQKRPFSENPNYQAVMRLGDEEVKSTVREADRYICSHLSELYRAELDEVRHELAYAKVVSDADRAAAMLEKIPSFPDSDQLRKDCEQKKQELLAPTLSLAESRANAGEWDEAVRLLESVSWDETARVRLIEYRRRQETENTYRRGVSFQEKNMFREAAEAFAELEDYKDSLQRLKRCNRMIKGKKVRAVGRKHTQAAWLNVFLSLLMALGCTVSAPMHILLSLLWGIPLMVFSIVMTIIQARYRPAKRMWAVMAAIFGLFLVLTVTGILPFGPSPTPTSVPSLIYLAMMLGSIFI